MRGHAFGLDLDTSIEVLGVGGDHEPGLRRVTIETGTPAEIGARVSGYAEERLSNRPGATIDSYGPAGYLLAFAGWGEHWVAAAGDRVLCGPPPEAPAWQWQRYLTGQLLPFAAILRGLEAWHASAVVLEGHAVALTGNSRAGKSTLAATLVQRGAGFLTDDVLALEPSPTGVLAHAGPGLANIRDPGGIPGTIGEPVGSDEDATRIEVPRPVASAPLEVVVFVERAPPGEGVVVSPLPELDPRRLLAATFNTVLRAPERLEFQLDICSRIAATARLLTASIPAGADPAEGAEAIARCAGPQPA